MYTYNIDFVERFSGIVASARGSMQLSTLVYGSNSTSGAAGNGADVLTCGSTPSAGTNT